MTLGSSDVARDALSLSAPSSVSESELVLAVVEGSGADSMNDGEFGSGLSGCGGGKGSIGPIAPPGGVTVCCYCSWFCSGTSEGDFEKKRPLSESCC